MSRTSWPATGRWRVKRYRTGSYAHGGPIRRWAVIGPDGWHWTSSLDWRVAQNIAQEMARGEMEAVMRTAGR